MIRIQKHLEYCLARARELPKVDYSQRLWSVVLDKRGNVLGEGSNSFAKSSNYQKEIAKKVGKPSCEFLHAEIRALTRVFRSKSRAKPYAIVTARSSRTGTFALAAPCIICESAIESAGIRHVFYSL